MVQHFISSYGYLAIVLLMTAESACMPVPSELTMLPVVRTFISLPAGYAHMRPVRFGVYTAVGCAGWIGGLAWAGYAAGANWQRVQHLVNTPAYVIAGLITLLLIAGIIVFLVRRRKRPPVAQPGPADARVSAGSSERQRKG